MRKGIFFAGIAYFVWGLFPIYFKALHAVPPIEILMHRMVWSLAFLSIVLFFRKQWGWLRESIADPKVIIGFIASALLLSSNWFIYIWAINDGRIVDASLGYFMTPLVNVLLGFILLKERLRPPQWLAVALAACGVVWLTWQTGHPPWVGLALAATFGVYGLLRKIAPLGPLEGLSLETLILFPVAFGYLAWLTIHDHNTFLNSPTLTQLILAAAGPITAIPLLLFAAGARRIPMATLGLLQYIAPTIQFFLGVYLYGEVFDGARLIGFSLIWTALVIYSAEGLHFNLQNQKKA